jgi:4-amino-4-deoxy-L-arabinose transferase-like glycosyltransferase
MIASEVQPRIVFLGIVGLALGLHLWGLQKELPFSPSPDETDFVGHAMQMVATGDPNPHWFGHPGSTVLYPLALLYAAAGRAPIDQHFEADPSLFFLLGRLLTVAYAISTLPLLYLLGSRMFDRRTALTGCLFSTLFLVPLIYAKTVRTDSAATFFGMLSLLAIVEFSKRRSLRSAVGAAAAIALAVSSRSFMAALLVPLAFAALLAPRHERGRSLGLAAFAAIAAVAFFFVVSPFTLLDPAQWVFDLHIEARSTHLGADTFDAVGNFLWHLTEAIPQSTTWPLLVLAVAGIFFALYEQRRDAALLLSFVAAFLVGISLHPLHSYRWTIPILPLLALFAAHAFTTGATALKKRWLSALLLAAIIAGPFSRVLLQDFRDAHTSTRILAREWIVLHLTPGSRIAVEMFSAPLQGTPFRTTDLQALSELQSIEQALTQNFRYAIASDLMYKRYFAEPQRYSRQVAFYSQLFAHGRLLKEFTPNLLQGGPTIRIYELRPLP